LYFSARYRLVKNPANQCAKCIRNEPDWAEKIAKEQNTTTDEILKKKFVEILKEDAKNKNSE
jgi:hypothetical protein